MKVIAVPALADNYIFILQNDSALEAAVVDPGEADPVLKYLQDTGYRLTVILNTHHHKDHIGGNSRLLERFPGIPVLAGAGDRGRIHGQTLFLKEGDEPFVCGFSARVLEVFGHTESHVAYFFPDSKGGGDLFSGDTVFGGTIGNLFGGTPEIMFQSIQKMRALPAQTRIWCSHEYTRQYVREAAQIEPYNTHIANRLERLDALDMSAPTIPLLLEEECLTNPFFRWDNSELNAHLSEAPGIETFRRLCDIT